MCLQPCNKQIVHSKFEANHILITTWLNLVRWAVYETQQWFYGETLIPVPHLYEEKN